MPHNPQHQRTKYHISFVFCALIPSHIALFLQRNFFLAKYSTHKVLSPSMHTATSLPCLALGFAFQLDLLGLRLVERLLLGDGALVHPREVLAVLVLLGALVKARPVHVHAPCLRPGVYEERLGRDERDAFILVDWKNLKRFSLKFTI